MADEEPNDLNEGDEPDFDHEEAATPNTPPTHRTSGVLVTRAGFQSLGAANIGYSALLDGYATLVSGTAGRAVRIPTQDIPTLLESIAKLLRDDFIHQSSGVQMKGYEGLDNLTITLQTPTAGGDKLAGLDE